MCDLFIVESIFCADKSDDDDDDEIENTVPHPELTPDQTALYIDWIVTMWSPPPGSTAAAVKLTEEEETADPEHAKTATAIEEPKILRGPTARDKKDKHPKEHKQHETSEHD
jgi:hypothetical protein